MLVKDQIKLRMQELNISHGQLARLCQTSDQTTRYWTSGRSNPRKNRIQLLEQALSFKIDWSEGAAAAGPTVSDSMPARDAQLFAKIQRLPAATKLTFEQLADQILEQCPVAPFFERTANGAPRLVAGSPFMGYEAASSKEQKNETACAS